VTATNIAADNMYFRSVVMLTPEAFGTALSTGAVHQGAQSEPHIIPSTARIEEISSSNSSHASQQV
jgi:hypothetical protein